MTVPHQLLFVDIPRRAVHWKLTFPAHTVTLYYSPVTSEVTTGVLKVDESQAVSHGAHSVCRNVRILKGC